MTPQMSMTRLNLNAKLQKILYCSRSTCFENVYSKRGDEIYYLQTKYIAGNTQNMEIPTVYEVYECIQTAVIHLG